MRFLGNDVVDLREPANQASAANPRFQARVLTRREQRIVSRQPRSGALLWALWSAKEAAYKALKKADSRLPFIHRNFQVSFDAPGPLPATGDAPTGSSRGRVKHGRTSVPVSWQWTPDWMHCVTEAPASVHRVSALEHCRNESHFAQVNNVHAMSQESAAARTLAVALLQERGIVGATIARSKQQRLSPPFVLQSGEVATGWDVSLSHDGRFAAAAICAR